MKKNYKYLFIILSLFMLFISCEKAATSPPKLLDLGADKCIPCKKMAPILEELKQTYAGVLEVEFIDVWKPENQQAASSYGIKSIPTQIFFDPKGNEIWRHVGFISKTDILNKWKELGYDLKPIKNEADAEECTNCSDFDQQSGGCSNK